VTIPFIGCASDAHQIRHWLRASIDSRSSIQTCMLYIMCIFLKFNTKYTVVYVYIHKFICPILA
jgi:hypothetical protein